MAERNEKGQFVKGTSGNPLGRPGIPTKLKEYAKKAPDKLIEIVEQENTPPRLKADILRWMAEMVYGKAPQAVDMNAEVKGKNVTVVKFEGEISEWAK